MTYTVEYTTAIYLVDSVISKLNKKEEAVDALVLCSENGKVTFEESDYVDISSYGLKKGDAVQVIANNGQLLALSVLYRAGSADRVTVYLEWPHGEGRIISGYANERSGNVLKLGYTGASDFDEIFNIPSNKAALIYDSERDRVYKGTLEECLTYKNSGSSASKVIIQSTWSQINKVIIYR